MSRRQLIPPILNRPYLHSNHHGYHGRAFIMVTVFTNPDEGLRVYLEHESIPPYFHGRIRPRRIARYHGPTIQPEDGQPLKGNLYLLKIESRNLQILIEPRSRSFYHLRDQGRVLQIERNLNRQLALF